MTWLGWLLIVAICVSIGAFFLYRWADSPGDDFGRGAVAWLVIAIAAILLIAWIACALSLHRLL